MKKTKTVLKARIRTGIEVSCPENLRQANGDCYQTGQPCTNRNGDLCPQIVKYRSRRARSPPRVNEHGYGSEGFLG